MSGTSVLPKRQVPKRSIHGLSQCLTPWEQRYRWGRACPFFLPAARPVACLILETGELLFSRCPAAACFGLSGLTSSSGVAAGCVSVSSPKSVLTRRSGCSHLLRYNHTDQRLSQNSNKGGSKILRNFPKLTMYKITNARAEVFSINSVCAQARRASFYTQFLQ